MLATPGGDGETAIRLVRQAQSRCRALTVIVPDQAKSAGTLFVLGADHIYMGPTSDLGPVDPQFLLADGSLGAARAIIAAVEGAETRIQANPHTYPLHAALLTDVSALCSKPATLLPAQPIRWPKRFRAYERGYRKRFNRLRRSCMGRSSTTRRATAPRFPPKPPGASACQFGKQPDEPQWRDLWRLWMKYRALGDVQVYEGENASVVVPRRPVE